MTVAELIKQLVDMPMDAIVVISQTDCFTGAHEQFIVASVELQKARLKGEDVHLVELDHDWDEI